MNTPKLSIVFSFRNEADVLPELLMRVRKTLNKQEVKNILSDYELIFINDASTDASLSILLQESKQYNDIRIINMSRRFGVTPCVLAGMEYASGDLLIYMDADLQDPPEVIEDLLNAWQKDSSLEVIHTIRKKRIGESPLKKSLTKIGYWILNRFSNISLPIEAGDFKLLSRRVVDHILELQEHKPFLRGMVCWVGFKQEFIKYDRQARFAGKTKFPVLSLDVINNFLESALISFSSAPLKLAIVIGALAILVDIAVVIHALLQKINGTSVPGWTAIMIVTLFLGGIQLFFFGIIGLYINAIYENTKNRPRYIVESTHGFS